MSVYFFVLFFVYECLLHLCMCAMHPPDIPRGQKRESDLLELE